MNPGQYVVFAIDDESYGLPIEEVEQIMHSQPVTRIPQTAAAVLGVINLRGKTINVVDTRILLGFDRAEAQTFIVVTASGQRVALTADRVDCITSFTEKDIERSADSEFYVGKQADRLIVLATADILLSRVTLVNPDQGLRLAHTQAETSQSTPSTKPKKVA